MIRTLTGYGLALAAAGLWLSELTGHEATKRKLRQAEEKATFLEWLNGVQALEIAALKHEHAIGMKLATPLRRMVELAAQEARDG